jgi:hypothetical protein
MKKIFYILAVVTVFAACKGKSDNDLNANKEMISLTDSTFYNSNYLTDTGAVANPEDFTGGAVVSGKATVPAKATPARRSSGGSYSNSGGGSGNNSSASSGSGTTATPAKKKGISKAAQGAIIGGVGGAVAGAVIGKGKGAVIGGVVGAAGGYIIGRSKDRKSGRVQ